jgi:uncharacterized protein with HEPN domain
MVFRKYFSLKNIMHPYTKYENTEIWRIVEKSINDLIENQDILSI